MKRLLLVLLVLLKNQITYSQNLKNDDSKTVYTIVQQMPKFPGDSTSTNDKFRQYVNDNIHYPETAMKANISGPVFVNFIVEGNGAIDSVKVLRRFSGDSDLVKEAIRVISTMPTWIPGKQNGLPVRVQYNNMPVVFRIVKK